MRWGQLGGLLLIGGTVVALPAALLSGPAGPGEVPTLRAVGRLSTSAALALVGAGVSVLGVVGSKPFSGRGVRTGLGALAVGLFSLLFFANALVLVPDGSNELSFGPTAYSLVVGALAMFLGVLVLGIGLLRTTGLARAIGSLFIAGLLLPVLAVPFNGNDGAGSYFAVPLALILLVLGALGIGALAIRAERNAPEPASRPTEQPARPAGPASRSGSVCP